MELYRGGEMGKLHEIFAKIKTNAWDFHVKFMGFEMISWDLRNELGWCMGLTIMFMGFLVGLTLI